MQERYDVIGINYNNTRKADPYLAGRLFDLLNPNPRGTYIDIGCGTGNYTCKLHEMGIQFIGVEPSMEMLAKAKEKCDTIEWLQGHAEDIPLKKESVDGALATLTLHHWKDISKGAKELNRVVKPGGKMVILTSAPEQTAGYWLSHYFPKMIKDSVDVLPPIELISSSFTANNFELITTEIYNVRDDLEDLFLNAGKNNPSLYFDEQVRKGISSFSAFSNASEVEQGLKELRKDVDSGKIDEVMKRYENDLGDYLFMVIEKRSTV